MRDLLFELIDTALQQGAAYADARFVRRHEERLELRNGRVEWLAPATGEGLGIRVLVGGAWGFAATRRVERAAGQRAAAAAVATARAAAAVNRRPVAFTPAPAVSAAWRSHGETNAALVPIEQKLELLLRADAIMRREPAVQLAQGELDALWEEKSFASSAGSFIEQDVQRCGATISATAIAGGEVQRRSWGDYAQRGWEFIAELRLEEHAARIAAEAAQLLRADPCPDTVTDVVIGGSQMALQVHESCGHPIELDRVLGYELGFAGGSFLTLDRLGTFRYGSEQVTISADATLPGGLGSFGFDDDGTPAQRTPIVERGRFVGYLTSRETAPAIGQESNGAARASGWNRIPLVRMTNVNLEPGQGTLEELVAGVDEGVFLDGMKSWSLDDRRLNFHFGCELGRAIEGGKLGRLLKNPTYTGITPQFWASCDGVAGSSEWRLWGLLGCLKGEPGQLVAVGHGAAPARFRRVRIGA